MAVHHVEVQHGGSAALDAGDLVCQAGEVRGED